MFGLICGLMLGYQPAPAPEPGCGEHRIEFNGNPDNWAAVKGCVDASGVVTWQPEDQEFSPRPSDGRRSTPTADRWIAVGVNGRPVSMWGWHTPTGKGWKVSDQRTSVLPTGSMPVKSGVVLPSGFEPRKDPKTGALLMGVDPAGLRKDNERIRASDPATKAEAEDLRQFYAMGPDSSAKTVARNLPKVISPNTWATVFGYDAWTAAMRVGGAAMLAAAAFYLFQHRCEVPA